LVCDTWDDNIKIFKSIAWVYGPCTATFKHLRPIITIDTSLLSGRYKRRLLMVWGYDVENKFFSLAFEIMDEEILDNWGWFMRWVRNEVIQSNIKIYVMSDQHKGIDHFRLITFEMVWTTRRYDTPVLYAINHKKNI
jgi:MULE transposase domain